MNLFDVDSLRTADNVDQRPATFFETFHLFGANGTSKDLMIRGTDCGYGMMKGGW